jgi:hypothetical protein
MMLIGGQISLSGVQVARRRVACANRGVNPEVQQSTYPEISVLPFQELLWNVSLY